MTVVFVAKSRDLIIDGTDPVLSTPASARRAALMRDEDRVDFSAARLAAVLALRELGEVVDPGHLEQVCKSCDGAHGQPIVRGSSAHVSWSHSSGWVAAAAAKTRVGVDVERRSRGLATYGCGALTDVERAVVDESPDPDLEFLRAWTAKEALVKVGHGKLDALATTQVLRPDGSLGAGGAPPLAARVLPEVVVAVATYEPVTWFGHPTGLAG